MSHELTTPADGRIEYAYLRAHGAGWHGLGNPVESAVDVDAWLAASGMGAYTIQRSKVRYAVAHGATPESFREMPESIVLFRSDNKKPLGLVSDRYKVVQPKQMLEFFRDIVKVGGLELSAAGTIYDGKRYWATARIGEASPLSVHDRIGGFLLISSSADGSSATEVRRTSTRVVCRNTLAIAQSEGKAHVSITHRSEFNPERIKQYMGLNEAAWAAFRHQIVRLGNINCSNEQAEETTVALLGGQQDKVRASAAFNKIMDLFNGGGKGSKLDGVWGTAWGYTNAVTEYVDHWTRARSDANRFVSAQWGQGADLKDRAFAAMLALAG
jgi:phage/plasmid-like protein (TIGR03299 family)